MQQASEVAKEAKEAQPPDGPVRVEIEESDSEGEWPSAQEQCRLKHLFCFFEHDNSIKQQM